MAKTRSHKRSRSRPQQVLQKPRGVIHPRVQKVGPEHFGIVSVDCAKARGRRPAPQRDCQHSGNTAGKFTGIHFPQRDHGSRSVDG
jgi:hypothetical protein